MRFRSAATELTEGFAARPSPDGSRLAYLTRGTDPQRATLVVRDLRSGGTVTVSSTCPVPAYSLAPLDWAEVERLHAFFVKYGPAIVFAARFMPVARTMVSLPAGMVRMNQAKFLLWTAAGSTIWITALAGAGSWFGDRFANLDAFVGPVALVAIGSLVLIYLWRVVTWRPRS